MQVLLGLKWLLVAFVLIGAVPLLVANYQFLRGEGKAPAARTAWPALCSALR